MAWIDLIDEADATGDVAKVYESSRKRSGRVYNIIKIQSQNTASLQAMLQLYSATMRGASPLTRAQREMMAVVVSKTNGCHY